MCFRFEIDSTPGTYFGGAVQDIAASNTVVDFDMGSNDITVHVPAFLFAT